MTRLRPAEPVEVTDLIRPADGIVVAELAARLRDQGHHRAARVVDSLPARDGRLDPGAVDALVLRVHCELQRLSEELVQPRRVADLLSPWVARLREADGGPVRVVDVGCGIGLTIRWLADTGALGPGVDLVGADLDPTLVSEAARLAEEDGLTARFVVADALAPGGVVEDPARTVVISSGLLHHLDPPALRHFFERQTALGVAAFAHWDPVPGPWAVLGARVFHRARMREPLSRHDGVASVQRAHPAAVLLDAASVCTGYEVSCADPPRWRPPITAALRPLIGVRRP